jgi:hypothetical protein
MKIGPRLLFGAAVLTACMSELPPLTAGPTKVTIAILPAHYFNGATKSEADKLTDDLYTEWKRRPDYSVLSRKDVENKAGLDRTKPCKDPQLYPVGDKLPAVVLLYPRLTRLKVGQGKAAKVLLQRRLLDVPARKPIIDEPSELTLPDPDAELTRPQIRLLLATGAGSIYDKTSVAATQYKSSPSALPR